MNKKFLSLFILIACTIGVHAQIRVPRLISDSMILQRNTKLTIWGWASPEEKIVIEIAGKKYPTITAQDKKWSVVIDPLKTGHTYDMVLRGSNTITIKNILAGDLWLCAGQSNMELLMERLKDKYPEVIATAFNPAIRQFDVNTTYAFNSPYEDYNSGKWETVYPGSIARFIAIGYFFADELNRKYKVPIGLLSMAVGGSPVEAWISEDSLRRFPKQLATLKHLQDPYIVDSIRKADQYASYSWYNDAWTKDAGMQEPIKWFATNYDDKDWKTFQLPGYWKDQGAGNVNGVVWFRREFDLPDLSNKQVRLWFGNAVDRDSIYINGIFVGTTGYQYPPRKYSIPNGVLKPGKNLIAVKLISSSGSGGFYMDKPYQLRFDSQSIDLTGNWKYKIGAVLKPHPPTTTLHYQPASLYNAMYAPSKPMAITGVIWYQGESDADKNTMYEDMFTTMIREWRTDHHQNFPFLFVQLANYLEPKSLPGESNWAALRDAQRRTLKLPNTAMAVAIDIGEWNDVHPLNKLDVGHRLALGASRLVYGDKKNEYSGPVYKSFTKKNNRIIIRFDHTGSGLEARNGELKQFAIAGADKKFVWANAIIRRNTVEVWSDAIIDPVAVRYAWADNPAGANLYNKEGLPAVPFKTDK